MKDINRLMSHISKDQNNCWNWIGGITEGYGIAWYKGKSWRAMRIIYILLKGDIPEGLQLDHLCRNTICVNPEHLEPVTSRENTLRGNSPARFNSEKIYCIKGHSLKGKNLHIGKPNKYHPRGQRYCVKCLRAKSIKYRVDNLDKIRKYDREWKRNKRLASA